MLLSNSAWQGNNSGTYEKFEGSFDLIQKGSGFSEANGASVAIDVSENPIVEDGVISGTVFSGTSTSIINKYTNITSGGNFPNTWFIQAAGIKDEYDDIATGNIYYDGNLTSGYGMTINSNNAFKLGNQTGSSILTDATNLLRFTSDQENRLTYQGKNKRTFTLNASISVRGNDRVGSFYTFFVRKIGSAGSTSETIIESNSIYNVSNTTNIGSLSITGTLELSPGQSVELWGQRLILGGNGNSVSNIAIFSQNLTID